MEVTIRAKFRVTSVKQIADPYSGEEQVAEVVHLTPVTSSDAEGENHRFWRATPSGNLEMMIQNPDSFGAFGLGQEFYLDFTPVGSTPTPVGAVQR